MDLNEMHEAIGKLLEQGIDGEERLCFEFTDNNGVLFQGYITGVTVVVNSDLWLPTTVVVTSKEIDDS